MIKAETSNRSLWTWAPLCICLTLAALTNSVQAVEPPPAPAGVGDIERNLEEAGAPRVPAEEEPKALIEQLEVEQQVKGQGESQVSKGLQFVLNGVKVQGNTVLDNKDIVAIVQPYIEKPADAAILQRIASEITALYARQGFVTSRCVIPPQQAIGGVVTLKMEENRLGKIVLAGKNSYRYNPRLFNRYLHDLPGQVIHQDILNQRLRQLSKLPVASVTPRLQAGAAGTTDLVLNITDRDNAFAIALDNQGTQYTGAERLSFSSNLSNLTGNGDPLALRVLAATENSKFLNSINLDYVRPVGELAGRIRAQAERTEYQLDPDETGVTNLLYEGTSTSLEIGYEQPFLITRGNYWWHADFERQRVESITVSNENNAFYKAGQNIVDGQDDLSVLVLGVRTDFNDRAIKGWLARNVFAIDLKQSLEGFLGSMTQEDIDNKLENQLDPDAITFSGPIGDVEDLDPEFTKLYLSYGRRQALPGNWILLASASGEYSDSKKVPESYKFIGAGDGTNGYRASLGISHSLILPQLQAGLSYNIAYASSYDTGEWTDSSAESVVFTLGYTGKHWLAYYSGYSDSEGFDTVDQQHRFYLSWRW